MIAAPRRAFSPPCSLVARLLVALCVAVLLPAFAPTPVQAAPEIWLPTPVGEPWRIIQGYGCGTHNGYDRFSLDLASDGGTTRGAPALAVAEGSVWAIEHGSGSVIIEHGGGYKSMYTHLQSFAVRRGQQVARGAVVGTVGNVGAPGVVPHLHFTLFHSARGYSLGESVPLSFAEGYTLPEVGGCNQHGGARLVSRNGVPDGAAPSINFTSKPELNRWYNSDQRIVFAISDDVVVRGFSQKWDQEPDAAEPMFTGASEGFVQTAWAGEGLHQIYVRAWDASGKQTVVASGLVGYDVTAPGAVSALPAEQIAAAAQAGPLLVQWQPASDAGGSGVLGYRLYLGPDVQGSAAWFEYANSVTLNLQPGSSFLRIQAVDAAGNAGPWATVAQFERPAAP